MKYLKKAADEAKSFLSPVQYAALVEDVKNLSDWPDGPRIQLLDIVSIDQFRELREKGGIYGKINVRVYFAYLPKSRAIYVLGAYKKEAEHQTPRHIVATMRNRLRRLKDELGE
ncbi:hypothetical protein [Fontivita pretiosa]|uniref:hypothetical protein n=1 Tax=Fontivita pretiosa TaxID=2989684 RepID=UPI003D17EFC2